MTVKEIMPGDRVLVFDPLLYKDDVKTPLSVTKKPATVLCRYGERHQYDRTVFYPDLVRIQFDHRKEPSVHFTSAADPIEEPSC